MSTRRSFFKFLGLGAGVAAGGVVAAAAILPDSDKSKAIKEIQAAGFNGKLTIGAEYGEIVPPKPNQFTFGREYVPGTRKNVQASITVGPDGEMYLMANGKWRRIVTE
jgi:hypothetical protein